VADIISIPGFFQPFSSLSHLLGAVVFAGFSLPLLLRGRGNGPRLMSLAIFCLGTDLSPARSGRRGQTVGSTPRPRGHFCVDCLLVHAFADHTFPRQGSMGYFAIHLALRDDRNRAEDGLF